jgi:hypothetical protein
MEANVKPTGQVTLTRSEVPEEISIATDVHREYANEQTDVHREYTNKQAEGYIGAGHTKIAIYV